MKERTKYIFSRKDIEHLLLLYLEDKGIDISQHSFKTTVMFKCAELDEIHIERTDD